MLYKNTKSYLKAIRKIANEQEISFMRGFDKLPKEAQDLLYIMIGDIQNNIADIERIIKEKTPTP